MSLKELAKKYHYKKLTGEDKKCYCCKSQLICNYLSDLSDEELWGGAFAKAYRSFNTYLLYFKKQDILIEKGIDPRKHKDYKITKNL